MTRGLGALSNEQLVFREFEREWQRWMKKDVGAYIGREWARHPAWGPNPKAESYAEKRWEWHQNLGELMGFHGTAHVNDTGATAGTARRLTVSLSHTDLTRLVDIQVVAGGRIKQNPHQTRLFTYEVMDAMAQCVMQAARLFIDSKNDLAFNIIDAAISFRRTVPGRGQKPTERTVVAQMYWKEQLDRLTTFQRKQPAVFHLCVKEMEVAGSGGPSLGAFD
jgi:hypothetical protein